MMRRLATKAVDPSTASTYLGKARGFRTDVENMAALVDEFSGNGIAVLCVHAAIAYADALAVRAKGIKSVSGDHTDAVDVLESAVRIHDQADRAALKALRYVLQRKDEVSYTTTLVRPDDAARVLERLAVFGDWAERRYDELA